MNSSINSWLSSGEYRTALDQMVTTIMRDSLNSNSEATTSAIFEREIYFLVRKSTGIKIDFRKEQKVDNIIHIFNPHSDKKGSGRLDAIVNTLIIEYKHHSKLKTKEQVCAASQQVIEYLTALYKNEKIKYRAILTDGIKIAYFAFNEEEITQTTLAAITSKDLGIIIKALVDNSKKKFISSNVLNDFTIDNISPSPSKTLALKLYDLLKNSKTEKTEMLFKEWQALMHLSVSDNGKSNDIKKRRADLSLIFSDDISNAENEYLAFYALQTTYAIIVKLIACKVIERLNFNEKTAFFHDLTNVTSKELQLFFEKMEDGYSYRSNNIFNLLEGDFFSWYSDSCQWDAGLWAATIKLIKQVDQYSAFNFNIKYEPIDIFKDLYMSIIPKSLRHSMGEYFTPGWLADYVVDNGINISKKLVWKAIDPCCGSGIFILSLIRHIVGNVSICELSEEEKKQFRDNILTRVCGIDINPLSVLSARVGYYVALLPFENMENIEIPIYLGDSAIVPSVVAIDGIECYHYEVSNIKKPLTVVLPTRLVKDSNFSVFMNELQRYVKTDDAGILFSVIKQSLNKREQESLKLLELIKSFAEDLTILHKKQWDGIWIRIVLNFMLIARLDKYDLIVGNPPWVKWEHLPAAYAKKIKSLCSIKHIFSNDGGQYGGTQLNICALIANVAATNWLTQEGILAMLMPDSIMSQNSYEEFRNFYINYPNERLFLQKIDRWRAPLRPFWSGKNVVTQDFNTYYFSKQNVDYSKGIEVNEISRYSGVKDCIINAHQLFSDVEQYLTTKKYLAKQLSQSTAFSYTSNKYDYSLLIGPTAYQYRTGVEFTPQELYMLVDAGFSPNNGHHKFFNKKFARSKYIVDDMPSTGWDFSTALVYPIITGPNLKPFHYAYNGEFCILPYSKENTKNPISVEDMISNYYDIFTYLSGHKNLIDEQSEKSKIMHRGNEFYALSKIGPYSFAPYIVAARDNSKFCASVIQGTKTPWGEIKNSICVKHTIIISQDKSNRFITEDEAFYITGILNSAIVIDYIQNTFKSNGYSLNKSQIYLPLYNENDKLHNKIVELAKQATMEDESKVPSIQDALSALYIDMCKLQKNNCS